MGCLTLNAVQRRWLVFLLCLGPIGLGIAGCDNAPPEPASSVTSAAPTPAAATPGPDRSPTPVPENAQTEAANRQMPKLDLALPTPPRGDFDRLCLLYTGLTQANLEVCGCPKRQLGGIAPRAAVVKETRAREGEILLLDAGRFMVEGDELERERCRVYLDSMDIMGYDAVALSSADFVQGYAFLEQMAGQVRYPFLSCNLKRTDGEAGFWKPYIVTEWGGYKVAVIGFTDPVGTIEAGEVVLSATDPAPSLQAAVDEVAEEVDFIVALGNSTDETGGSRFFSVARDVTGVDYIIGAILNQPEREFGGTVVLSSELDGKKLGRLDINVFEDGETYHRTTFIELGKGMEREAAVRERLNTFYQGLMRDERYASEVKDLYAGLEMEEALGPDSDNAYAGVDSCVGCHLSEHRQWLTTPHSGAFFTLLEEKKYYVPECISCHVTGYDLPTGFGRTDENNLLRDVQCEVCHGPGKKHIEWEQAVEAGEAEENVADRYIRKTVDKEFCESCHDQENSPQFQDQFSNYWDIVKHKAERLRGM